MEGPQAKRAKPGGDRRAPDPSLSSAVLPRGVGEPPAPRGRAADFGVDVKGVRRATAPEQKAYGTGALDVALRIAGSSQLRRSARRSFRHAIYAKSSLGPRRSKLRTVRKLLSKMGRPFLPVTTGALSDLAAILIASKYRSAGAYLSLLKKEHILSGESWTLQLETVFRDCLRAATRGLGPARRAATMKAETFDPFEAERGPVASRGCYGALSWQRCWGSRPGSMMKTARPTWTSDRIRRIRRALGVCGNFGAPARSRAHALFAF